MRYKNLDILEQIANMEDVPHVEKSQESKEVVKNSTLYGWTMSGFSSQSNCEGQSSQMPCYRKTVRIESWNSKERIKFFLDQEQTNNALIKKYKQNHFLNHLLMIKNLAVQSIKDRFRYIAKHYLDKNSIQKDYAFQFKVELGDVIVKEMTSAAGQAKALWEKGQKEVIKWINDTIEGILELQEAGIFHADLAIRNTIKVNGIYKIIDFDLSFKVKLTKDQGKEGGFAFEHTKKLLKLMLDNPSKNNCLFNNYLFRCNLQDHQSQLNPILSIKNNKQIFATIQDLQAYSLFYHKAQLMKIIKEILDAKQCRMDEQMAQFIFSAAQKIFQREELTHIRAYLLQKLVKAIRDNNQQNLSFLHENNQEQVALHSSKTQEKDHSQTNPEYLNTSDFQLFPAQDQSFNSEDCYKRSDDQSLQLRYSDEIDYFSSSDEWCQIQFLNQLFLFRYLSSKRKVFKYIANHYFDKFWLQKNNTILTSKQYKYYARIHDKGQQFIQFPIYKGSIMSHGYYYVYHWIICLIRAILELQETGIFCRNLGRCTIRTAKYHFLIINFNNQSFKVANYCNQRAADRSLLRRTKNLLIYVLTCDQRIFFVQDLFEVYQLSEGSGNPLQSVRNMQKSAKSAQSIDETIKELMEFLQIYSLLHHRDQLKRILERTFQDSEQSLYTQIKDKVDSINVTDKYKNREGYEQLITIFKKLCSQCPQPNCVCRE